MKNCLGPDADFEHPTRKGSERPAMIVELKFDGSADGAIAQVRERNYPQLVQEFTDRLLLVGVNYDKKTKRHECRIERWGESPSLHQTTDQVTDQVLRLLSVMDGEMSSGEMMRKLGLRHLPTFRTMYREPALSLGLIAMTKPEKHTSPTQKYYLTEKGKKLLDL